MMGSIAKYRIKKEIKDILVTVCVCQQDVIIVGCYRHKIGKKIKDSIAIALFLWASKS